MKYLFFISVSALNRFLLLALNFHWLLLCVLSTRNTFCYGKISVYFWFGFKYRFTVEAAGTLTESSRVDFLIHEYRDRSSASLVPIRFLQFNRFTGILFKTCSIPVSQTGLDSCCLCTVILCKINA